MFTFLTSGYLLIGLAMTDEKIVAGIASGDNDKELSEAVRSLYEKARIVTKVLLRNGDYSKIDVESVFQSAIVTVVLQIRQGRFSSEDGKGFSLNVKLSTYFQAVFKYQLYNESKKLYNQNEELKDYDLEQIGGLEQEDELIKENDYLFLEEAIASLPEKCRDILEAFYFKKQSMKEIALRLTYSTEDVVKTVKYRCLERLRKKFYEIKQRKENE